MQTTQKQTVFRKCFRNLVWISVLHILSVLLRNANQNGLRCVKTGVKFRFASTAQFGKFKTFLWCTTSKYRTHVRFCVGICNQYFYRYVYLINLCKNTRICWIQMKMKTSKIRPVCIISNNLFSRLIKKNVGLTLKNRKLHQRNLLG